jgi:hypothetical protein
MIENISDAALRKIKRCMELSKSSNENEAAIALKQMKLLMDQHNVTQQHVMAVDVVEKSNELDVVARPARWVLGLHSVIAQAMDCEGFVTKGGTWSPMQVSFLGVGASPEIAGYAFEVLYKKLKNDRAEFIQSNLQRFKRSNKTKLADAFCDGWVANIYTKVKNLSPNHEAAEKIKAYKETNADKYSKESFKVKDRYDRSDNKAQAAMHMGASSSSDVNLFVATGHQEKNLIGANQ